MGPDPLGVVEGCKQVRSLILSRLGLGLAFLRPYACVELRINFPSSGMKLGLNLAQSAAKPNVAQLNIFKWGELF